MESKEYKTKSKKSLSFNQILSFIAFIGIGCIAIALIFALIFKGNTSVAGALSAVGQVIAYSICMVLAYSWIKTHKHIAWMVCYVVFVVTIVVLFILNLNI